MKNFLPILLFQAGNSLKAFFAEGTNGLTSGYLLRSGYSLTDRQRFGAIIKTALFVLMTLFSLHSYGQGTAIGCNCNEYIYLNEPSGAKVHKFKVEANGSLTEITIGGNAWYPGSGSSALPSPHGLGTDINGRLYIGENGNPNSRIRQLTVDGVISPTSTFNLLVDDWNQNTFSIGNTLYINANGGPKAYDLCTGQYLGQVCLKNWAGNKVHPDNNLWGLSYNARTEMVYVSARYRSAPTPTDEWGNVWAFTRAQLEGAIANGTCITSILHEGTSDVINVGENLMPNSSGAVFGVVGDNDKNFYVVKSGFEADAAGAARGSYILKYDAQAKFLAQSPFSGATTTATNLGIGIIWSESTNKLYMSNYSGDLTRDCISAYDAATMAYTGTAVSNSVSSGNGSKALAIIRECCPDPAVITIDTTFCGNAKNREIFLQELLRCEGIIGEGIWTPDPSNVGVVYDDCSKTIKIISDDACAKFVLQSDGTGNAPQCPAFSITLNIGVEVITQNTLSANQTICSGETPALITSNAVSATGTITYQWQKSTTDCTTGFTDIAGAQAATYQPDPLTQTTYYRLLTGIEGSCADGTCSEFSSCVTVTVNPKPNAGPNQSPVCSGGTPITTATLAATPVSGGTWTPAASNPTEAVITAPTSATSEITGLAPGVYQFIWGTSAICSDTVTITIPSCVCNITLTPTVSGCYQNSGSKATVSIEVAWQNAAVSLTANDASDTITVTFGGQTKTINPGPYTSTGGNGSIVSPQVVAFELPADASTQTAQAFIGASYAASTCKAEKTGIILPAACPPTVCEAGQTGGTVWNDYNADGVKQKGESSGLAGVTVKAYDCNGTLVGTAITDAFGIYAFTGLTAASYPIRVEFSDLPSFTGQGTVNGTDGRTTTQFVNAADCNVDLGILDPTDYCQTNPKIIVPCYLNGDPLHAGSSEDAAIVSINYDLTGNKITVAKIPEVASVWGMAYNRFDNQLYSATFLHRHVGLTAAGLGGIFKTDLGAGTSALLVDVETIGVNLGTIGDNASRGVNVAKDQPSRDEEAFAKIGKVGMGDLDISTDGSTLYFVNLFEKKLHRLDIANPTAAPGVSIPDPKCNGGSSRPWALKIYKGHAYVGIVCDANIGTKSDLRAFVYNYDLVTNTFNPTPVFDFPLTYPKGFPWNSTPDLTGWYPWTDIDTVSFKVTASVGGYGFIVIHPQPILSDIEFDIDGSMVLGFADRFGFQTGHKNQSPSGSLGSGSVGFSSLVGGDILRAYSKGSTFVLENNAKAGPSMGYGPNNNQGPGFGEFYNDDMTTVGGLTHAENSNGGLAIKPGSGETVYSAMDPVNNIGNSGGIRIVNNTTGLSTAAFNFYTGGIEGGFFAKAAGIGDVELNCGVPVYLEIGNRVWNDTNKNGVQDPCEKVLTGVNVSLYKGSTRLAGTQTDANGEYYFSSKSKIGAGTWSGTGADTTLLAATNYKLVFGEGQLTDGKLTVAGLGQFDLTLKDATANNGNDQNDSDAEVLSGAFCINLTTGSVGSVNHTFDAGFYCTNPPVKATFTQTKATCTGPTENNNGKISLTSAVTPYDKFRVKLTPAAWGADSSYATATAIGSTFPKDLVTTAPNAGATYTVRFYTGECCYKDTTITVVPTPCVVGSIGDYVWKDANRNGKQDGSETGVNGVKVILWSATTTGTPVAKLDSTATAGGGKYLFSNLPKGDYVVQFVKSTIPPECSGFTAKDTTTAGTTDTNDSDADKTTGITAKITLDPKVLSGTSTPADSLATNNFTVDAGFVAPQGSLGDFVWKDTNNNGIQDETTPNGGGVDGVQIELYKNGTLFAKDTTDATGKYLFTNLDAGTYKIKVLSASLPAGCEISSVKDAPSDDTKDSDVDKITGFSGDYVIDPTDPAKKDILTVDAALYSPKGSIGDFVWKDVNNNGIQDETTPNGGGVAGVQIELYKNGTLFAKDTTDATGNYLFTNLDAGTYKIKVLSASLPAGCEISSVKDAPSDDTKDSDVDKITGFSGDYVIDPTDPTKKDIATVDAALYSPKGSLGDFVWKDTNNNGIQDETTPNGGGVADVQVELYKNGTLFAKDTTDDTGKYLFSNLDAGTYKIKVLTASLPAGCEISSVKDAPSDDTKDSDVDKITGFSGDYVINPTDPAKKDILTVDAALAVPCVKSKVTLTTAPVCSADVQTYSLSFSVTNKVGTIKVNKGTLTGSNPYTVTGIPSGATVKITDSLSAVCTFDTLMTGPNCNCNPPTPVLITPSLTACIGDTFPTIKATVLGSATVEWFATATSTAVLFTGLTYKPAGNVTAAGATFYAQARSTDPTCPTAISTGRVIATVNAQNCTVEVDLALKKSINKKIAQISDELTYTLKVWNESNTNATGVEVTDSIATTVQFVAGSFTAGRGSATILGNVIKWTIGNIAAAGVPAAGDTVTLIYKVKATKEGIHFNTAEISKVNEKDIDSTPGNGKEGEDDIDRQCFTVPVKLCPGEKVQASVPTSMTNVQWFKNGGTTAVATGNTVLLTEVGTYRFTATNQTCPVDGCCPIIIEPGINCCITDICIPFTVKKRKK